MTALWISVAVMGCICVAGIAYALFLSSSMRVYNKRGDQRAMWLEHFSELEMDEIKQILTMLCHAYMIPVSAALSLRPDDKLLDIQQQCSKHIKDDIQLDVFLLQLADHFAWKPDTDILPLSLADIVRLVLGKS